MCGTVGKMVFGLALVFAGLWLLVPFGKDVPFIGSFSGISWEPFVTVFLGALPVFLILIGILIAWIEWEEYKIEKPRKKKR